jgi:DNA primase
MEASMDNLLDLLDQYHGYPRPDRKSERWILCPFHADRKIGSFSYGPRGFRCFACDEAGSLRKLADHLGLLTVSAVLPRPRRVVKPVSFMPEPPQPPRDWQTDPDILARFQPISPSALTYAHSRGLKAETIKRWRIGAGMLPSSRARFPRLILPVIESGKVVGLRGRAIDSRDDAPKWLVSAGSKTTLFGLDELRARPGETVIVCEAPLACVLAMQEHPDVVAVASTAGCGTWRDEWADAIAGARPIQVVVWMDADEAGEKAAVKVANSLCERRLPVHVYRWPKSTPPKTDLADVVTAGLVAA